MSEDKEFIRFMAVFTLPESLSDAVRSIIPEQREMIKQYLYSGKIIHFALTKDRKRFWIVFSCSSEAELLFLIDHLPLTKYLDFDYHELLFLEMIALNPTFSVN